MDESEKEIVSLATHSPTLLIHKRIMARSLKNPSRPTPLHASRLKTFIAGYALITATAAVYLKVANVIC